MSILYFIAALAGIVLVGVVINKLTGTKYQYLADLRLDEDEKELWSDDKADYYNIQFLGRSKHYTFQRLHIATVIVTNKRIIIAKKLLPTDKVAIIHQFYMEGRELPNTEELRKISREYNGGFYGRGYSIGFIREIVIEPFSGSGSDCVQLVGSDDLIKYMNIGRGIILTDNVATFPKGAL